MVSLDKYLADLSAQSVLCVGDLMLDEFVYGDVSRISPEAPTPVITAQRSEIVIGGAGNVARNIAGLGASCLFVGVIGEDAAANTLTKTLLTDPNIQAHLVVDPSRPTTRKVRFVSEHFSTHMLRADWEQASPVGKQVEDAIIEGVSGLLGRVGAVILSDYAKGVLTPRVVRTVIDAARRMGKPVIVDPKGSDYSIYRGATVITPNRKELAEASRHSVRTHADVAAAAADINRLVGSDAVLVTMSEDGLLLQPRDAAPVHVPAYPVQVRDVSGAGDTVVAVLAVMLAGGADFETAMRTANAAASVVVGKRGTATVSTDELRARILPAAVLAAETKIVSDRTRLDARLDQWRRQDLRIGFTNGCFDLLHPGHIRVLTEARGACDRLVVGLNSDASVRRLKGDGRPVQDQKARAEVLAALEAVDLVVVFDEDTPLELIKRVKPSVLVKGGDYTPETVVGREVVEAAGGRVVLIDLVPGHSTSDIIKRSNTPAKAR